MKTGFLRLVLTCLTGSVLFLGAVQAKPADKADKPEQSSSKKKAAKKAAAPKFIKGSEESVAERTARLKRECKGGVNAGACAGFTR